MMRYLRPLAAAILLMIGVGMNHSLHAQKRGGILTVTSLDSPGGLSVLEEATYYSTSPMAGVFNNLIMFDQNEKAEPPGHDRSRSGDWLVLE